LATRRIVKGKSSPWNRFKNALSGDGDTSGERPKRPSKPMKRAVKLWGFNQWIIARYVLLRKDLKLMKVDVDRKRRLIRARWVDRDLNRLVDYYALESRYTPFFWESGLDPFVPVKFGPLEEVQDMPVNHLAKLLNTSTSRMRRAIKRHGDDFISLRGSTAHFEEEKYKEFREVIQRITRLGAKSEEFSHMCMGEGFHISVDGISEESHITKIIDKEVVRLVELVEKKHGPQNALPVEVNEMISFQQSLEKEIENAPDRQ